MNVWLAAAGALLLGLVPCAVVIVRRDTSDGLAALQVAGIVTTLALLVMARGFGRPGMADIALTLALLAFPAGLLFAHFLERWL